MRGNTAHPESLCRGWLSLKNGGSRNSPRRPVAQLAGRLYLYSKVRVVGVNFTRPHSKEMKLIGLILLGTLGGVALTLDGQVAAPPSVDLYSGQKQPEVTATPAPEPSGPDVPELSQLDEAFKRTTSLGKEGDERRLHLEWRQLKNRVVNDPEVRAAKATAQAARTDLERRNLLRDYYNIYYQRMSALASSAEMKLALNALKAAHQNPINQPRVRPTPTPEGYTPTPAPTPAHKKKKHKK